MSTDDILGMVDDAKVNEGGSGNFIKHHDRALMQIEKAQGAKTDFGQGERVYIDVELRLLVSSTENKPKSEDYEGDVLKARLYFPAVGMGDKEKEVKASILKKFFASAGVQSLKEKGLKGSIEAIVNQKIKVAIGLKSDFYIDKNTNEPIKTTYPEYKFSAEADGDLFGDLNKLATPRPMSSKRQREFEQKLEYFNDNASATNGGTALDDDDFLTQTGVQDDFDL